MSDNYFASDERAHYSIVEGSGYDAIHHRRIVRRYLNSMNQNSCLTFASPILDQVYQPLVTGSIHPADVTSYNINDALLGPLHHLSIK